MLGFLPTKVEHVSLAEYQHWLMRTREEQEQRVGTDLLKLA